LSAAIERRHVITVWWDSPAMHLASTGALALLRPTLRWRWRARAWTAANARPAARAAVVIGLMFSK